MLGLKRSAAPQPRNRIRPQTAPTSPERSRFRRQFSTTPAAQTARLRHRLNHHASSQTIDGARPNGYWAARVTSGLTPNPPHFNWSAPRMNAEWVRKTSHDTTVVFVHGILSSGDTCWRDADGSYWPSLLTEEEMLEAVGVYVFSSARTSLAGVIGSAT